MWAATFPDMLAINLRRVFGVTSLRRLVGRWLLSLLLPVTQVGAQSFQNLHNFVFLDGTGPVAPLLLSSNILYGTTRVYGGGDAGGYGSVFKLNTDGSGFTNLHTFSAIVPEGGNLNGGLILSGATLYGTASFGGGSNYGCVFAIGTNGLNLTNLYNFSVTGPNFPYPNNDGDYPFSGLLLLGNTLYGTANGGGTNGWGTVFSMGTNGSAFTNLHNFTFTDGQYPSQDLIVSGGTLFGATGTGGSFAVGTLFAISTNGTGYTNFYSFPQPSGSPSTNHEGAFPACKLVLSSGKLYGTASEGGNFGNGTIFMINTNGTGFALLHTFTATSGTLITNNDGARPKSGLLLSGNTLYGTASLGGAGGNGTVFKINMDGNGFTTLHSFSATNNVAGTNTDGAHPIGGLISSVGAIYGTASAGGTAGYGTLFSISTPPILAIALSGTNAVLTWPTDLTGYNLESATNVLGIWGPVSGQYSVTNPVSGRQRFFRLVHP
jgi:uncharacterized repeat protein (TIGR03803 family)